MEENTQKRAREEWNENKYEPEKEKDGWNNKMIKTEPSVLGAGSIFYNHLFYYYRHNNTLISFYCYLLFLYLCRYWLSNDEECWLARRWSRKSRRRNDRTYWSHPASGMFHLYLLSPQYSCCQININDINCRRGRGWEQMTTRSTPWCPGIVTSRQRGRRPSLASRPSPTSTWLRSMQTILSSRNVAELLRLFCLFSFSLLYM